MLDLVLHPDARLRAKSVPVTVFDESLRALAQAMLTRMAASGGCGLAAIQVGHPVRLVTLAVGTETPEVMVNPTLLWRSVNLRQHEEGCLSMPGIRVVLARAAEVRIGYQTLDGTPSVALFRELGATCAQHELDHLEGGLMIDRVSRRERETILGAQNRR